MLRLSLAPAFLLACLGTAQGAECSVAVQKRWEHAMQEISQIEKIPWRMRYDETNTALQCRMRDALIEISSAAKEYFPACDPFRADRAHVLGVKAEDALGKFGVSKCAKPQPASAKRSNSSPIRTAIE